MLFARRLPRLVVGYARNCAGAIKVELIDRSADRNRRFRYATTGVVGSHGNNARRSSLKSFTLVSPPNGISAQLRCPGSDCSWYSKAATASARMSCSLRFHITGGGTRARALPFPRDSIEGLANSVRNRSVVSGAKSSRLR